MSRIIDPARCALALDAADRHAPALLTILDTCNPTELQQAFEAIGDAAARALSDILWQRVDRDA